MIDPVIQFFVDKKEVVGMMASETEFVISQVLYCDMCDLINVGKTDSLTHAIGIAVLHVAKGGDDVTIESSRCGLVATVSEK